MNVLASIVGGLPGELVAYVGLVVLAVALAWGDGPHDDQPPCVT